MVLEEKIYNESIKESFEIIFILYFLIIILHERKYKQKREIDAFI